MQFQIQFAHPDGQSLAGQTVHEVIHAGGFQFWQGRVRLHALEVLEHFSAGATAAVPVTEGVQADWASFVWAGFIPDGQVFAAKFIPGFHDGFRSQIAVVTAQRRPGIPVWIPEAVRQHARTINAFPLEQIVWETCGFVPAQFGGEEIADARLAQQLRQRAREPKRVRQPGHTGSLIETRFNVTLPVQQLPHQRFPAEHLRVRFDPHATNHFDPAFVDTGANAFKQRRVVILEPGVNLGAGLVEIKIRVAIHQAQHGGKRASGLASGF